MDEATSALDELSERSMMELLRSDLALTTAIFVGRREGLEAYFDRVLSLSTDPGTGFVTLREASGG